MSHYVRKISLRKVTTREQYLKYILFLQTIILLLQIKYEHYWIIYINKNIMTYIKKNIKIEAPTLSLNDNTYKGFLISELPSYFDKIEMLDTFNHKGFTFINVDYLK